MARKIGANRNTTDTATVTTVTVGDTNAVTLLASNPVRLDWRANLNGNGGNETVYIREYPAATDNIKQGRVLVKYLDEDGSYFNLSEKMEPSAVYTGEISAISESGNVTVYVTEY